MNGLRVFVEANVERKSSTRRSTFPGVVLPYISHLGGLPIFMLKDTPRLYGDRIPVPAGMIGVLMWTESLWLALEDGFAVPLPASSGLEIRERPDRAIEEDILAAVNDPAGDGTSLPYTLASRAYGGEEFDGTGQQRDRLAGLIRHELPTLIQQLKRSVDAEARGVEQLKRERQGV